MCVTTYLSLAPQGLREALITGGLPPLGPRIDEVYASTYERVVERNGRYYGRHHSDHERVLRLRERLQHDHVRLPSADRLTWRRFRQAGQVLDMSDGAERLHYLLELSPDSPAFFHDAEERDGVRRYPISALLQEAAWADGGTTRWSAERMLPAELEAPHLFTGEHVYSWAFDDYGALTPLRGAAHLLADREWSRLYDDEVRASNDVPTAAAIYAEGMYVERRFSEETASPIRGIRTWPTNEYDHNGVRVDGERILGRLLDLARAASDLSRVRKATSSSGRRLEPPATVRDGRR